MIADNWWENFINWATMFETQQNSFFPCHHFHILSSLENNRITIENPSQKIEILSRFATDCKQRLKVSHLEWTRFFWNRNLHFFIPQNTRTFRGSSRAYSRACSVNFLTCCGEISSGKFQKIKVTEIRFQGFWERILRDFVVKICTLPLLPPPAICMVC
jgi:hypothetical protein